MPAFLSMERKGEMMLNFEFWILNFGFWMERRGQRQETREEEEGRDDPAVVVPLIRPLDRAAVLRNSDDRGGIVPAILRTTAAGSSLPF